MQPPQRVLLSDGLENPAGLEILSAIFEKMPFVKPKLFPDKLTSYCQSLVQGFAEIPEGRKKLLEQLGAYIARKRSEGLPANIIVICTHNSRRSHIGQLWLWAAAQWYGVDGVHTYSGGTEASAFNHRSVAALQRAGFPLTKHTEGSNPVYELNPGSGGEQLLFSKKYDEAPNPKKAFAAVLVCSEAGAACPFVPGADDRFSIPYQDPKDLDDSPQEVAAYDERVRQIGREMFYAMRQATRAGEV